MERRVFLNGLGMASAGLLLERTHLSPAGVDDWESHLSTVEASAASRELERIAAASRRVAGQSAVDVAQDEDFWREIQQSFSVSRSVINLNNAGLCACPRVVTDAVLDLTMEQEKLPPYTAFTTLPPRLEKIRVSLARVFGCDPEELAIVRNATEALQTVLLGVELEPGDEVLTTSHDYWAMLDGLEQRRHRDGIRVRHVPVSAVPERMAELVRASESGITSRTRLILVSHLVNLGGQIYPVREICDLAHARGIEVVVDGAQSFGMLDFKMDDLGCDYFGTSLHKWLMAPKGTGALYVRRDKIASTWPLLPPPEGVGSDVRKFEALGTIPATSLAIGEAIAFHNGIGAERKEERLRYLTRYWADRLAPLPGVHFSTPSDPGMYCAIATVGIQGVEPHLLHDHLWEEHRIRVTNPSARAENIDGVRVSPGLQTTLEELDIFCEVMEGIARNGL
jgi:selenocysteine lyase/cysteine desulfurase